MFYVKVTKVISDAPRMEIEFFVLTILKVIHRPVFYLKQRFGDWILSPSSGGTYSVVSGNRDQPYRSGPTEYVLPESSLRNIVF
jgi:hypothetical protein